MVYLFFIYCFQHFVGLGGVYSAGAYSEGVILDVAVEGGKHCPVHELAVCEVDCRCVELLDRHVKYVVVIIVHDVEHLAGALCGCFLNYLDKFVLFHNQYCKTKREAPLGPPISFTSAKIRHFYKKCKILAIFEKHLKKNMYDLAIIGGGPGGYVAAERAGAAGMKVVLFERRELGGVCLNEGCIPTKTLLYSAKVYEYALHAYKYGITVPEAAFDYAKILKRKEKTVRKLVGGVKLKMKNADVEVVKQEVTIAGKAEDGSFVLNTGEQSYSAARLLICSGSEAVVPPIPGLREAGEAIVTNREILALQEPPKELVVIGGGVIGMEFASLYNSLGSKVTVIEMLPKILGPMDGAISAMLQRIYTKKGVEFHLGCKVTAIEGSTVVYTDPEGQECRAAADRILVSVGRRANVAGLGLESIGVEFGRGIKVDSHMRTNVPGVWAAGDVTGFSMLAHTASREGEVAVADMLGKPVEMSYKAVPGVVYTNPEVAGVGLTQEEAEKQGLDVKILELPMAYSGRFVAENEGGEGVCRIIVDAAGKVLGVHMLGNPCSEMIHSACIAIEKEMTVEQLKEVIFPHPTVSEIVKEVLFTL